MLKFVFVFLFKFLAFEVYQFPNSVCIMTKHFYSNILGHRHF